MKESQWKRIIRALLKGEHINRIWGASQLPMIAQPGNRCNELIAKGFNIQKKMIYTGDSRYMDFWMNYEDRKSIVRLIKRRA